MRQKNHVLVLLVLHRGLQLDTPYRFRVVKRLFKNHGFARANQLVCDLIEWGLLQGPLHALMLQEAPLDRANPAEWQPYAQALQQVQTTQVLTGPGAAIEPSLDEPAYKFSAFAGPISNTVPHATTSLYRVWLSLTNPPADRLAKLSVLRAAKRGTAVYQKAKVALPYVIFGGVFHRRAKDGLVQASGLGALDYDHYPDAQGLRDKLVADEAIRDVLAMVFVSPSGQGLKVVVRIPEDAPDYTAGLKAVHEFLCRRHPVLALGFDQATLDISRASFLGDDPGAWIHPDFIPQDAQ